MTPDDDAAVKELAYGKATLTGGAAYDGPVPASVYAAASGVTQQNLVAVQAARVNAAYSSGKATGLDAESVTDLTGQVSGGRLSWTPPDSATWVILSYWQRGSGQQPEAGPHSSPPRMSSTTSARRGPRPSPATGTPRSWTPRSVTS